MQGNHKFRFKNPLYSLDASSIDLSLSVFRWAAHRDDTANVQLSVGLNHDTQMPEFVALSDRQENDLTASLTLLFQSLTGTYLKR